MKQKHEFKPIEHIRQLAIDGIEYSDWYSVAQSDIKLVANLAEWEPERLAAYLALLSPRMAVRRSIRATLTYLGQGQFIRDVLPTIRRSIQIYEESGVIGGHKVPYFHDALLGNPNSVTLDTHMATAMLAVANASVQHFRRKATMAYAIEVVSAIGDSLGISPRDCQAAIWCGELERKGQQPEYFPLVEEYHLWRNTYGGSFPLSGKIPF